MRGRCLGHIINLIVKSYLVCKEILEDKEEEERLIWTLTTAASYEETQGQGQPSQAERGNRKKPGKKKQTKGKAIEVLVKLHDVIVSMANSTGRTKDMREEAGRLIPRDNATRWNGWNNMVTVACEKQEALDTYCYKHRTQLGDKTLIPQDWEELRAIRDFLKIFKEATLKAEGHHGTIGHTLILLDLLYQIINVWLMRW